MAGAQEAGASGRKDLASRIEWIAEEDDGAGFDVLSFDKQGSEKLIEVKTTKYDRTFPFLISKNEVDYSAKRAEAWHLYRVFTFTSHARIFVLQGDISTHCRLDPQSYRASF